MIKIIQPYGYCYGVKKSIQTLTDYHQKNPNKKLVLFKQLVHDKLTSNQLIQQLDAEIFSIDKKYDSNDVLIYSAHGIIQDEFNYVKTNNLDFLDCTCPILVKTNKKIEKLINDGIKIIFFGKKNHDETKGFLSRYPNLIFIDCKGYDDIDLSYLSNSKLAVICQSTLSKVDYDNFLKHLNKFNLNIVYKESICPSCLTRWEKALSVKPVKNDVFIVFGSLTSSNGTEFFNLVKNKFINNKVYYYQSKEDVDSIIDQLKNANDIFLMSATSFPNLEFNQIINYLKNKLSTLVVEI